MLLFFLSGGTPLNPVFYFCCVACICSSDLHEEIKREDDGCSVSACVRGSLEEGVRDSRTENEGGEETCGVFSICFFGWMQSFCLRRTCRAACFAFKSGCLTICVITYYCIFSLSLFILNIGVSCVYTRLI